MATTRYTVENLRRWCQSVRPGTFAGRFRAAIEALDLDQRFQFAIVRYRSANKINANQAVSDNEYAQFACRFLAEQFELWASGQATMTDFQRAIVSAMTTPSRAAATTQYVVGPALLRHNSFGTAVTLLQNAPDEYLIARYSAASEQPEVGTTGLLSEMRRRLERDGVLDPRLVSSLTAPLSAEQIWTVFATTYNEGAHVVQMYMLFMLRWNDQQRDLEQIMLPLLSDDPEDLVASLANKDQSAILQVQDATRRRGFVVVWFRNLAPPFDFVAFTVPPNGLTLEQLAYDILEHYRRTSVSHPEALSEPLEGLYLTRIEGSQNQHGDVLFIPILNTPVATAAEE